MIRIRRSMSWADAVMKPSRIPGARILDSESKRRTRPSTSRERKEGIREEISCVPFCGVVYSGLGEPVYGSIWRKSTD